MKLFNMGLKAVSSHMTNDNAYRWSCGSILLLRQYIMQYVRQYNSTQAAGDTTLVYLNVPSTKPSTESIESSIAGNDPNLSQQASAETKVSSSPTGESTSAAPVSASASRPAITGKYVNYDLAIPA
jgi:hypothetical protein